MIVAIVIVAIAVVVAFTINYFMDFKETPQQRLLHKYQKKYFKNRHKHYENIVSQEVTEEDKSDEWSSYLIGEDGTIIKSGKDSLQKIKYVPISTEYSKKEVTYISAEDAVKKDIILKKRLFSGEQIDFADCNYMLDTICDVDVLKAICKNYIHDSIYPPINIIENYDSDRSVAFYDMIHRIINLCVSEDNGWNVKLPAEFVKNTILFSTNVDALYLIADFQEKDICDLNYDNKPNISLFNEIKELAYKRYNYLISRRK